MAKPELPKVPPLRVDVVADHSAEARASGGFLNVRRLELTVTYPSGATSAPFAYDVADRRALDAVIVVAHFRDARGARQIFLRSAVRPPVALRSMGPFDSGNLWEVPAGIIEVGEEPRAAGARELLEELGIARPPSALAELGPWTYPAPAVIGERHVYLHVEVDPAERGVPLEDGSPLEREGVVVSVALEDALALARAGRLRDAKTETALRRLAELP